jgi:hypothetical protein
MDKRAVREEEGTVGSRAPCTSTREMGLGLALSEQ